MNGLLQLVDAEATAKAWLKADPGVIAAVGDRVFYGTPQSYEPDPKTGKSREPQSWLVVKLVSETHTTDEAGFQHALVQFDCWGRTKALAAAAALAVQAAGRQLTLGIPVTVGPAVIVSGDVSQRRWLPDPTTNSPRYAVDLLFELRGALV